MADPNTIHGKMAAVIGQAKAGEGKEGAGGSLPLTLEQERVKPFVEGFRRAIQTLQGGIPSAWVDMETAAAILAASVPKLTQARLIAWCKEGNMSLEVLTARVLTDMFATEPGLLELSPTEAAEEGAALMQQMWPQAAFQPRIPTVPEHEINHPVLDELRKLGGQWHRLSLMPIDQAKQQNPTLWRAKVLNDIAVAKAHGLAANLTKTQMLAALESAGDRWVWEIPPPAAGYYNDEFGAAPQGMEPHLAPIQS